MPVTDAADALFAALRANQAITLTGEASQGYGVEVTGEATKPACATPSATPDAAATPARRSRLRRSPRSGSPCPTTIAGTTAAQVTCTRPQD